MIRRLMLTAAVVSLAACSAPEPAEPTPDESAPPVTEQPTPPATGANVLSAQGFGPLRIGMTRAEVEAALGADANPDAVGGPDPQACDQFRPARAPEGLLVMVENGVLTSVWLTRNPALETDRGVNVGDTAAEVRRVYGAAAVSSPHKYESAPAEYLTVWAGADHDSPAARGVKFTVSADGKVQSIAGGGPSIQYVEGCA